MLKEHVDLVKRALSINLQPPLPGQPLTRELTNARQALEGLVRAADGAGAMPRSKSPAAMPAWTVDAQEEALMLVVRAMQLSIHVITAAPSQRLPRHADTLAQTLWELNSVFMRQSYTRAESPTKAKQSSSHRKQSSDQRGKSPSGAARPYTPTKPCTATDLRFACQEIERLQSLTVSLSTTVGLQQREITQLKDKLSAERLQVDRMNALLTQPVQEMTTTTQELRKLQENITELRLENLRLKSQDPTPFPPTQADPLKTERDNVIIRSLRDSVRTLQAENDLLKTEALRHAAEMKKLQESLTQLPNAVARGATTSGEPPSGSASSSSDPAIALGKSLEAQREQLMEVHRLMKELGLKKEQLSGASSENALLRSQVQQLSAQLAIFTESTQRHLMNTATAEPAPASGAQDSTTVDKVTISLFKEDMKFSCGHFTIFGANSRERLHGHNFYVKAKVIQLANLSENGMAADYNVYKKAIRAMCDSFDEKVLLPQLSSHLQIEDVAETVDATASVKVTFASSGITDKKDVFLFPKEDVLILPIRNVTVEDLAKYIGGRIVKENLLSLKQSHVVEIEMSVSSGYGQSAEHTTKV